MPEPTAYQKRELARVREAGGTGLLAHAVGTGKTYTSIWSALDGLHDRVLIVAPLRTLPSWQRSVQWLAGQELRVIRTSTKAGKAAFAAASAGEPGWYWANWEALVALNKEKRYDGFKKKQVFKAVPRPFGGKRFDVVIADEAHRAANWHTLNSQVLCRLRADRRLALSATPAGNRPVNIYGVLRFLWPDQYPAFGRFADRNFNSEYNPWSTSGRGVIYLGEKHPGRVAEEAPCWSVATSEEAYGELPDASVEHVQCKLTRQQWAQYKSWKDDALAWLGDHPVAVDLPATLDMRLRQATLGECTVEVTEDGEPRVTYAVDCKSSKLDALIDILEDLPEEEKVVVYCHSRRFMAPLLTRLKGAGMSAVEVSGAVRDQWQRFLSPVGPRVLCAVIPAIAEGVDGLQKVCHTEVWLSWDNSVILNQQAIGRLHRKGQTCRVQRYVLEAPDTVDVQAVAPRLREKYRSLAESGLI